MKNEGSGGGFTLTELLIVLAVLGLLAALLLVAMGRSKGGNRRGICTSNLRQLSVAVNLYSEDHQGLLPPWRAGLPDEDLINDPEYCRYAFFGPASARVPGGPLPGGWEAHNLGYLYGSRYVRDGSVYFCPTLTSPNSALSAAHYAPLLTTPPLPENPFIRAGYLFNPRVVDTQTNRLRRFRKSDEFQGRVVLLADLAGQGNDTPAIPHAQDRGLNVLFSDGSVSFSTNPAVWNLIEAGNPGDLRELAEICRRLETGP